LRRHETDRLVEPLDEGERDPRIDREVLIRLVQGVRARDDPGCRGT
jgi:hypothetical protein